MVFDIKIETQIKVSVGQPNQLMEIISMLSNKPQNIKLMAEEIIMNVDKYYIKGQAGAVGPQLGKVKRNKVFVSYSHKDKDMLERVRAHLKVLEIEGISLNLWDDTKIKSGMTWRDEIEKAISSAKIAILLVSTYFLASDFIQTDEIPPLLTAAQNDGATILPLILKPCRFSKNKKLSVFQAVNNPAKPLSKLSEDEQDEVLLQLTDRIVELMKENI